MWARVDDHFDEHPKVFIAAKRLGGPNAAARVLAVWLEARCWTNRKNTLGFIPMDILKRFRHDDEPLAVAAAMSAPLTDQERATWNSQSVHCLWIAVEGGFRFHDDEEYRPKKSAEELHELRSESGRRGGQASAAKRKQIASPNGQQTVKQLASTSSTETAAKSLQIDIGVEANSNQTTKPVSRIPSSGSQDPGPIEERTAPPARQHPVQTVENPSRRLALEPNGDNYKPISKLASELLAAGFWEHDGQRYLIRSEGELVEAVKDECGRLLIDRGGRAETVDVDVIHRACASTWFKHTHNIQPQRRRA